MIPEFNEDGLLPPGIHRAPLDEFKERFVRFDRSDRRLRVYEGLERLLNEIQQTSVVKRIIVVGSFVTAKAEPNDFDCILVVESSAVDRQLNPFEYQLISHRMVRRVFKGDVLAAEEDSEALDRLLKFFQTARGSTGRPCGDRAMISDEKRLEATLQKMTHLLRALDDVKQNVLPRNPEMFAAMAEGYVDQLALLRDEIESYLAVTKSAG